MVKVSAVSVFATVSVLALGLFIHSGSAKACPAGSCGFVAAPVAAAPAANPAVTSYNAPIPSVLSFDTARGVRPATVSAADGNGNASDSGLAAFVGPWGAKSGFVSAKLETVGLQEGKRLTVDLGGDNLIAVTVGGAQGPAQGRVLLTTHAAKGIIDGAVNMSGVSSANHFSAAGGAIVLGQ